MYHEMTELKEQLLVAKLDLETQTSKSTDAEMNMEKYKKASEKKEKQLARVETELTVLKVTNQENMSTMDEQSDVIDGLSKERDALFARNK